MESIEQILNTYSLYLMICAAVFLLGLAIISLRAKLDTESKKLLFFAIVLVTLIPTIFISSATVYLNIISSSGGPVHWHADFEIWNCGKEVELIHSHGLSNKVGTPTLHTHDDKRIHVEGLVMKPQDINLSNFFNAVGGELNSNMLSVPTGDGLVRMKNGMSCKSEKAELQVFIYKTDKDNYFSQKKVDPASYVMSPESNVPPADCIIIEFSEPKTRTDKLCRSYKVAEQTGKLKGEKNAY